MRAVQLCCAFRRSSRPNATVAVPCADGLIRPRGRRMQGHHPFDATPLPFRPPPAYSQPDEEFPLFQTARHQIDSRRADPFITGRARRGRRPRVKSPFCILGVNATLFWHPHFKKLPNLQISLCVLLTLVVVREPPPPSEDVRPCLVP
jgi:hypothetical protein